MRSQPKPFQYFCQMCQWNALQALQEPTSAVSRRLFSSSLLTADSAVSSAPLLKLQLWQLPTSHWCAPCSSMFVCVCLCDLCVCVHAQGSKIDKGISLSSFGAHTTWLLIPAFAGRASNVSLGKICFRRTAPLFSRVRCHWVEEAYSIAGIRPVSPVSSHSM